MTHADWAASATLEAWQQRADMYDTIRDFFRSRNVLAVETPLLANHTVTDPHIESFSVNTSKGLRFLQTSPEFAMKRMLATYAHPIYQLCKAFRREEVGHQHRSEFTMLEWYRPEWSLEQLIEEVGDLLTAVLHCPPITTLTYQVCFEKWVGIDPHIASHKDCHQAALKHQVPLPSTALSQDDLLHLLMNHCVEPQLSHENPVAIVDYPASQSALAELSDTTPPVAKRFEVFVHGIELANGYQELRDPVIQEKRMEEDNALRESMGLSPITIDPRFIKALPHCPRSAGVAMGVDRLLMIKHGYTDIANTLSIDDV